MSLLIPKSFSTKTGSVQLSDLDTNFTYLTNTINTALDITGTAVTVYGTLGASGIVTLANNLAVGGTIGATGAVTLASTLDVTGAATLRSVSSTIPTGGRLSGVDVGSIKAPGTVVQVINSTVSTQSTVSIPALNTTFTSVPNISVTITPKFSNSKILIQCRWFGELSVGTAVWDTMFGLKRGGTSIGHAGATGAAQGITMAALSYYANDGNSTPETVYLDYYDSPASTSALTYELCCNSTAAFTLYTNRVVSTLVGAGAYEVGVSSITAWEIAQ